MKCKIQLVIAFLFAGVLSVNAQWLKSYDHSGNQEIKDLIINNDGNILVIGKTDTIYNGRTDAYISKLSPQGDTIWTRAYSNPDYRYTNNGVDTISIETSAYFSQIIKSQFGGYYVHGAKDQKIVSYNERYRSWVVRLNEQGDTVRSFLIGDNSTHNGINELVELDNGDLVFTAFIYKNYDYVSRVYRTDSLGNIKWEQDFDGAKFYQIKELLIGENDSITCYGYGGHSGAGIGIVIQLDSAGNEIWRKEPSYGAFNEAVNVGQHNYVLGRRLVSGRPESYLTLFKLDLVGDTVWSKDFRMDYGTLDGSNIIQRKNGNISILSSSNSDLYINEFTTNGDSVSQISFGTNYEEYPGAFIEGTDSLLLIAGFNENISLSTSDRDKEMILSLLDATNQTISLTYETAVACDSLVSTSGKYTWKNSGVYYDTLQNQLLEDSVVRISLTINRTTYDTIDIVSCDTYTAPSGKSLPIAGLYLDTIGNSKSCDSVLTINLSYSTAAIPDTIVDTVCNIFIAPSGKSLTSSGVYYDTTQNQYGCDTAFYISLVVNYGDYDTTNFFIDAGDSVLVRGTYVSEIGIYTDSFVTSKGCDSLIVSRVQYGDNQYSGDLTVDVPNGVKDGDYFGYRVGINKDYAIVTAPRHDFDSIGVDSMSNSGAAFIYQKDNDGKWEYTQKIHPESRTSNSSFGYYLNSTDDYVFVGATYKVYVFEKDSVNRFYEHQILDAPITYPSNYGRVLAASGDVLAVGANEEASLSGSSRAGCVYIYERGNDGVWDSIQRLEDPEPNSSDYFGDKLAVQGDYVFVGTYAEDYDSVGNSRETSAGAVFVFKKDSTGSYNLWQKLTAPIRNSYMEFGAHLSVDGDYLAIGTDENSAGSETGDVYMFKKNENDFWRFHQMIWPLDDKEVFVSDMSGGRLVLGSSTEDYDAFGNNYVSNAGAMYLFELNANDEWKQQRKIVSKSRASSSYFGVSVGISQNELVVGAYGSQSTGRAHFLRLDSCSSSSSIVIDTSGKFTSASGKDWFSSGVYKDTILNSRGCDSIITYTLTIAEPCDNSVDTIAVVSCDLFTSLSGKSWSNSGIYADTLVSSTACDSFVTYSVTILGPTIDTIEIASIDSALILGDYYYEDTVLVDSLKGANTCDSIVYYSGVILEKALIITYDTFNICKNDSAEIHGLWQSLQSQYIDTISSDVSDSISIINLYVHTTYIDTMYDTISTWDSIAFADKYYSKSGVYNDTLQTVNGCDSVISLHLFTKSREIEENTFAICEGDSVLVRGVIITQVGEYRDTVLGSIKDSIYVSTVTVLDTKMVNQTVILKPGESYFAGGTDQTEEGDYQDVYTAANGCDSIVTTTIVIDFSTNIGANLESAVLVYPNPVHATLTIVVLNDVVESYILFNSLGAIQFQQQGGIEMKQEIDVSEYPSGLYYLKVYSENETRTHRIQVITK